jgi:RNAse (barnase) inhibitor barstar
MFAVDRTSKVYSTATKVKIVVGHQKVRHMNLQFGFPPSSLNEWYHLDERNRKLWLNAASNRFFARSDFMPSEARGRVVVIDGMVTDTLLGFYCAIGEAVNGLGGYFGCNMNAFDDCLYGGFGLERPYTIVWKNCQEARFRLGSQALLKFLDDECESVELYEEGFEEGLAWVIETRRAALSGERTLFDQIVSSIHRERFKESTVLLLE